MCNYYICLQICLHIDISLFTGTKILPDPHYKPPKDKKKNNGNAAKINIQIAPKNDRSLAPSNKPEFIALSSDEENEESNDGDQERSKKMDFFKAASRGDLKMLKNMIKTGFKDIDQFQDEYDEDRFETETRQQAWPMTPLQVAAYYGHVESVEYLIEIGADIEKAHELYHDMTALLLATYGKLDQSCYGHNKEVITRLLQKGAKVNVGWTEVVGKPKMRPLDLAIEYKDESLIKLFIQNGANEINEWNDEIIELFHKLEVPVANVIDKDGNTLFHFAVAQKRPEDVKLMLQDGTQTFLKNRAGRTPFHQAAGESTLEIVKLLYFNDDQTNLRDEERSTPLHYAVEKGKLDVATFLVQNGASLNLKDSSGRTPLHCAAKQKTRNLPEEIKMMEFLLQNGALVNSKDSTGRMPLHDVAEKGSLEIVKLLLQNGAQISSRDSDGRTPLQIAINSSFCQKEVWEYLIEKQKKDNNFGTF